MNKNKMYGICFTPEIINDKVVMLKPYSIIEGNYVDNNLIDGNGNLYTPLKYSNMASHYVNMYGLGILEEDLLNYVRANGFTGSPSIFSKKCAELYLDAIKRYIFFFDCVKGKVECTAIRLTTRDTFTIDFEKNAISQLTDMFGNSILFQTKKDNSQIDKEPKEEIKYFNPTKLYEHLTSRVIGQDEAAKKLCTIVSKNIRLGQFEKMKSNILLYGPTGCGKTELAESLAKELNLPIVIEDVTHYTASGYVGDSVKSILRRLYSAANYDMKKAEHGIVVLDEIDKLASTNPRETVNTVDVQKELLKILEHGKFNLIDSEKTNKELIMDTTNIIFILCGAFSNFQDNTKRVIGFTSNLEQSNKQIKEMTTEDLVEYGLEKEFVGRIPVRIPIKELKSKEYEDILNKSSISYLKTYELSLLAREQVTVVYDDKDKFISNVAQKTEKLNVGARGLQTVIDDVFMEAYNDIIQEEPSERVLLLSSETVDNPKIYQLRKIGGEKEYELSKRNGASN